LSNCNHYCVFVGLIKNIGGIDLTALRMTIKRKLIILVLVALIPLFILELKGISDQYNKNIYEELQLSTNNAETIKLSFMKSLEENWSQQYAIGVAIISNPQWGTRDIEGYINKVFSEKQDFKRYSWISPDGVVLASSNEDLSSVNVQSMDYYKRIINGEKKVVSDFSEDILNDGNLIIHIARGIYVNDELKGIMLGILDVNKLIDIIDITYSSETASFGLIDNSGMMVHRHNYSEIPFSERKIDKNSPMLRAYNEKIVTFRDKHSQFESTIRLGSSYLIEEIGWISYFTVSTEEVLRDLLARARRDIIVLLLTSAISIMFASLLANRYTTSIGNFKEAVEEITKGNFSIKTEFKGKDEIAATSEAFNRMTEEISNQFTLRDEVTTVKTQFFSTVSHELKTPINIILGAVQLMEKMDNINKDSIRKYLKMQKQNSLRLLRLINNLIDINKIETNQFEIKPINYDVVRLVEDITTSVVEYTSLKNIEIVFDTEVEEKIMAVDPDKIERIILNLISNSIKFTEPGGKIEVTLYDKEDMVLVSIKDTGIGIPVDMQQKIFKYFTQVDDLQHKNAEGSGIGLCLVKSLVEMHGGSIKVQSSLGEGSEFIIELPVVLIESNAQYNENDQSFINVEKIRIEFSDIYINR